MASQQLSYWICYKMRKQLKKDIARNSRQEKRMILTAIKNGACDFDNVAFTPYRNNKNDAYYD